jgi:hypothetical protein
MLEGIGGHVSPGPAGVHSYSAPADGTTLSLGGMQSHFWVVGDRHEDSPSRKSGWPFGQRLNLIWVSGRV